MIVCSHGDVSNYCEDKDMIIVENYDGDIKEYNGVCKVLVTDQSMTEGAYFSLKSKMLIKGVELVSVHYCDTPSISEYILNTAKETLLERQKYTGRYKFGFERKDGVLVRHKKNFEVARLIIELRDAGYTLTKIQEDSRVRHPDGRKISLSTIQMITKNRKDYE